jgi:nitrite reductase/ring-hydroxylating ferredoxin subunit
VGIAVGIAGLVLWWFLGPDGDGDTRALSLPEPGEVAAAFVDGEPVFVVHDDDGEVRVLDAVDPHAADEPKVLAYCRDAATFEDLRHGSRFTVRGHWLGGPAPTGMAAYEIVERDDEQVTIGDLGEPPAREDADLDGIVLGPSCVDRMAGVVDGAPDPAAADDLVVHDGPASDDDERWYPVTGLAEFLEEWADTGDPGDDAGS